MAAGSIGLYAAAVEALWRGEGEEAKTLERQALEATRLRRRIKTEVELHVLGKQLPPASKEQDQAWLRGKKASALHKAFDKLLSASAEASGEGTRETQPNAETQERAQDDDAGAAAANQGADAPLDDAGKRRNKKKAKKAAAAPDT